MICVTLKINEKKDLLPNLIKRKKIFDWSPIKKILSQLCLKLKKKILELFSN
jgi:hypothetical protein